MGYTHYWKMRRRRIPREDWGDLAGAASEILKAAEYGAGIPLADGSGEGRTRPTVDADEIVFNGLGEDSHEGFGLSRVVASVKRGTPLHEDPSWDFCKTARKPYDIAVTAILAVAECLDLYRVSSDGTGEDWLPGVDLARQAAPRFANLVDIPLSVRKDDRWIASRSGSLGFGSGWRFAACVDGRVYLVGPEDEAAFCSFATMEDAEAALALTPGLVEHLRGPLRRSIDWRPDRSRVRRAAMAWIAAGAALPLSDHRPPAFVRPGEISTRVDPTAVSL